jgi:hypothetical protein
LQIQNEMKCQMGKHKWTILNMRWPILGEYLALHPEIIGHIGEENLDGIDKSLQYLYIDPEVINVINGGDVNKAMTKETLILCSKLLG